MAKYYYNGVLLPEIPAVALTKYTKFVILQRANGRYRLFASTNEWYVNYPTLFLVEASEYSTYLEAEEDNAWTVDKTSTDEGNYDMSYGLIWANHDIRNGSATTTDIRLYGSDPVPESGAEEPEDILYSVHGSSLTAIGDAIRAKKDTTAIFTPAQMAVEIEGIVDASSMPSAEDAYFGRADGESDNEYGFTNISPQLETSQSYEVGNKFTANETFAVTGFRFYPQNVFGRTVTLWDVETQTALATLEIGEVESAIWHDFYFDHPVNLISGKQYILSTYAGTHWAMYVVECNPKITLNASVSGNSGQFPSSSYSYYVGLDIIIADTLTESVVTEYKVQLTTMDDIAEEVQRITGTINKMSTAQIISKLNEIESGGIPENARLYYVGNANSEFASDFESSAVGALSE